MPILSHSSFDQTGPDELLWRYLDLSRFLSMVTSKSLWLSNLELLAKNDPYEGIFPKHHFRHRDWKTIQDLPSEVSEWMLKGPMVRSPEAQMEILKQNLEHPITMAFGFRRTYFLNCWHISTFESAAMWQLYSQLDSGIAITSTFSRLSSALAHVERDMFFGRVRYADYDTAQADVTNGFNPLLMKRQSFSFEQEARLVFWDTDQIFHPPIDAAQPEVRLQRSTQEMFELPVIPGIQMPVPLQDLIENVWLSPTMPGWIKSAVGELCATVGLDSKIKHSTLLSAPGHTG